MKRGGCYGERLSLEVVKSGSIDVTGGLTRRTKVGSERNDVGSTRKNFRLV